MKHRRRKWLWWSAFLSRMNCVLLHVFGRNNELISFERKSRISQKAFSPPSLFFCWLLILQSSLMKWIKNFHSILQKKKFFFQLTKNEAEGGVPNLNYWQLNLTSKEIVFFIQISISSPNSSILYWTFCLMFTFNRSIIERREKK